MFESLFRPCALDICLGADDIPEKEWSKQTGVKKPTVWHSEESELDEAFKMLSQKNTTFALIEKNAETLFFIGKHQMSLFCVERVHHSPNFHLHPTLSPLKTNQTCAPKFYDSLKWFAAVFFALMARIRWIFLQGKLFQKLFSTEINYLFAMQVILM